MPLPPAFRPSNRWRDTPPMLFPPILGLFALGHAWRFAARHLGAPAGIGEMILGATTLLFLFCLTAWISKPVRRPGVIVEELRTLPGRAGLAAMIMCMSLLAATLEPFAPRLAVGVVSLAAAAHLGLAALVLRLVLSGPPEGRAITPAFHLMFAGPVLMALTLIPLGLTGVAQAVFWFTLVMATAIWTTSGLQLLKRRPPAPMRPILAVHLAPASLFASVATMLDMPAIGVTAMVLATFILLAMLGNARWLTEAGFSPFWGSFTFPIAAYAAALLKITDGSGPVAMVGAAALVAATLAVAAIAGRVLKDWARGTLAGRTNAAIA